MNIIRLFSIGNNIKLARDVAVFNLPAGPEYTCPGATPLCAKVCYAKKAYVTTGKTYKGRLYRFEVAKSKDFLKKIIAELSVLKAWGIKKVRIHESGDFFSQKYLNDWVKVMKTFPEINFLAYTKSFDLDFKEAAKLPNFNLIWSIDKTTTKKPPFAGPIAYMLMPEENKDEIIPNAYTCKHKSKHNYCGKECNICWTIKKNKVKQIYFKLH